MTSPLQRITQYAHHARTCAALARAARANGNPVTAAALTASARGAIDVARALRATLQNHSARVLRAYP